MSEKKPIEVFERYEMKYMLSTPQYEYVLERLLKYMDVDSYSQKTGFYSICNIYYDTPSNELIRRSIEKPAYKEKLRLRSYGTPQGETRVFLEIKKKSRHLVTKRRVVMKLSDAYRYMAYSALPKYPVNTQILKEIDYMRFVYELCPKLYLSYQRKALAGKEDPEFRITFDKDILTRREDVLLENGDYGDELLAPGMWLMEVKVLNAMPLWCARILSEAKAYPSSFSKYGAEYERYVLKSKTINADKRKIVI